jgi:hypothetical protein
MSNLTAEATGLIREMLLADGALPEYNVSCARARGGSGARRRGRERGADGERTRRAACAQSAAPCAPHAGHARAIRAGRPCAAVHGHDEGLQRGAQPHHDVRGKARSSVVGGQGAVGQGQPAALLQAEADSSAFARPARRSLRAATLPWPYQTRRSPPRSEVTAAAKAQQQQQQQQQQDEEGGQEQAGSSGQGGQGGGGGGRQRGRGAGGGGGGGGSGAVDWQQFPESSGAVVIYHELIMKLKRILLTYMCVFFAGALGSPRPQEPAPRARATGSRARAAPGVRSPLGSVRRDVDAASAPPTPPRPQQDAGGRHLQDPVGGAENPKGPARRRRAAGGRSSTDAPAGARALLRAAVGSFEAWATLQAHAVVLTTAHWCHASPAAHVSCRPVARRGARALPSLSPPPVPPAPLISCPFPRRPQFAAAYDDGLREYFGFKDSGIGMDLTTVGPQVFEERGCAAPGASCCAAIGVGGSTRRRGPAKRRDAAQTAPRAALADRRRTCTRPRTRASRCVSSSRTAAWR